MAAKIGNKYAVGNTGGRPRKVAKDKVAEYGKMLVADFEKKLQTLDTHKRPVFIEAWARQHDISDETLRRYKEENKEFCDSYNRAKQIQKELLIEGAMRGYFNATFSIFAAKNITDMRDRHELGGLDGEPIKMDVNILGAITRVYADTD